MAIAPDGSTPAAVDLTASTSATVTTASFSPPANSMIVIVVNIGYRTLNTTTPTVAVADSASNSFTAGPLKYDGSENGNWIFTRFYSSAPGSITVTATRSGTGGTGQALYTLVPYVLTGSTAAQTGAASGTASGTSTAATHAITSTVAGSWVIAGVTVGANVTFTASNLTSDNTASDATDLESAAAGHAVTGSPGSETIGFTLSASDSFSWAALEILPQAVSAITLADAAGAADLVTAQITSIPVRLITAPPRPAGPHPPPVRAQILTVPQGSAVPADKAGAAETMTAGTVTVPLADSAGAADTISGGIFSFDQAGAAEVLAVSGTVAIALGDSGAASDGGIPVYGATYTATYPGGGVSGLTAAVQTGTSDYAASTDASHTGGLTQADAAGAADTLAAAITVPLADRAAAADAIGQEPAIGASGGATIPRANPGTSQVAVAAPGSSNWVYLGSIGTVTALKYSFTCPGGADSMTCTVMVPASYRNQAFSPGWQVKIVRGGHDIWHGKMDEPAPTASGWNFTAVGNGMRGADFLAIYSDTWPTSQPDESINNAIARGLPWVNPGVGSPAGLWTGQAVDSGGQTITGLLTLICTRGALTWYVNSQPGGVIGDDLSVFPLPATPNRLLISTTPVPRTLGGDINTIYIRYQITADNTSATTSSAAPATYGLTVAQNAQSVAMHGVIETFVDLSDVGVQTAGQAQQIGNYILQIYVRASFAGPFVGSYGSLMNMGGVPLDPGCDQAGSVVRLILTDFGMGGELTPGTPIQFCVGSYEWDDFSQTFTISPYQALDQSLSGLLSMENTTLTPIQVAST